MSGINKIDERSENPANELMDAIHRQLQDLPVMPELQDPLKVLELEQKKPFGQRLEEAAAGKAKDEQESCCLKVP